MKWWFAYFSVILSCLFIEKSNAVSVDSLQSKVYSYVREQPQNNLYVHLDRNEYAPGDTIWMKAYMLSPISNDVLFVRLLNSRMNIVLQKQFPVKDIRSNGEMALPDTLQEGDYQLMAYMDKMIQYDPENVFLQPIRVYKNIKRTLKVEAFVSDANRLEIGKKVQVVLKAKGTTIDGLKGRFQVFVRDKEIKSGKLTTNKNGEAFIRFDYPNVLNTESARCHITLNGNNGESSILNLNLRHSGNASHFSVSPEGGHLLEGFANNLVVETWDDSQSPISAKLVLLQDGVQMGRVTTNEQGFGHLSLTPKSGAKYEILIQDSIHSITKDLPCTIEKEGCLLRLEKQLDSTKVCMTPVGLSGVFQCILRSFETVHWCDTFSLSQGQTKAFNLPLENLPAGILSLIVCDETGKPLAERLFMNKNSHENQVQLSIKKKDINGIKAMDLQVQVMDALGNPVLANLSVSLVEASTIHWATYKNILQSYYFHALQNRNRRIFDDLSNSFDLQLQTNYWKDNQWTDIYNYRPLGFLEVLPNTGGMYFKYRSITPNNNVKFYLKTQIWKKNHEINGLHFLETFQPSRSSLNRNTNFKPYVTKIDSFIVRSSQTFVIKPHELMANENEERLLTLSPMLTPSNDKIFDIEEVDWVGSFDSVVTITSSLKFVQPYSSYSNYIPPTVKTFSREVVLKEFDVFGANKSTKLSDIIGDYYCLNIVLNCLNHAEAFGRPKIGCVYSLNEDVPTLYHGPGKPFTKVAQGYVPKSRIYYPLRTIQYPKPFFYPTISDATWVKNERRTTLYWNPNLNTNTKGKAEFQIIYSGDVQRECILIIQGIDVKTFKPVYFHRMITLKQ